MGNEDAYKKMYEMGKELMDMATAGGYSPEGESEEEYSEGTPEAPEVGGQGAVPTSNKVNTALSFLKRN